MRAKLFVLLSVIALVAMFGIGPALAAEAPAMDIVMGDSPLAASEVAAPVPLSTPLQSSVITFDLTLTVMAATVVATVLISIIATTTLWHRLNAARENNDSHRFLGTWSKITATRRLLHLRQALAGGIDVR